MMLKPFTPIEPTIIEAEDRQTSTLIFLHGVGDCGESWSHILTQPRPSHNKLICPTAPKQVLFNSSHYPVTSWFRIPDLDRYETEDEEGIKAGSKYIHYLIQREVTNGIPSERIVLGGFAIGAALALYSALTFQKPLAGVIMISGYLPLRKSFPEALSNSKQLPIYNLHGEMDSLIKLEHGMLTDAILKTFMENVNLSTSSCPAILKAFEDILQILLP